MSITEIIPAQSAGTAPRRRAHTKITLPEVVAGQLWLIEQRAEVAPTASLRQAIAAANVVIYDRTLAEIVADALPLGTYAEPAAGREVAAARSAGFARDGWSVVRVLAARAGRRERTRRVQDVVDELAAAQVPGRLPVMIFTTTGDGALEQVDARFDDLAAIVDSHARETDLTIVIAAFPAPAAASLHTIAANGLAG